MDSFKEDSTKGMKLHTHQRSYGQYDFLEGHLKCLGIQ